jgi:hypothetical protein
VEKAIDGQRRNLESHAERISKTLAKQEVEFQARLATLREQ